MTALDQLAPQGADAPEPATDVATTRRRLFVDLPRDAVWGWLGPLLVTAVAGVLRFTNLGLPQQLMTDELYYAKDAWAQLQTGVPRQWGPGVDAQINAGQAVAVPADASFVVHPDVGRWLIAAGEQVFGLTPLGWRFVPAVLGTLAVLIVARTGRRLFRSTLLGCLAGLLLALDGLSIVMSRAAFLDGPLTFFLVAAFGALVVDRDRSRAAYDTFVDERGADERQGSLGWGPRLWWRPWRLLAGVCLGLACGTKWSGAYALVVFGLLTVLWDAGARRAIGVRAARTKALLVDAPVAFVTVAATAVVVYVASWASWFLTPDGWDRQWATENPATGWAANIPDALRSLWHYHAQILDFHRGLSSPHDYASDPWGWLVLTRPFLLAYDSVPTGQAGCTAASCSRTVLAIGTPAFWWAGVVALVACLWFWVARRDWRAGAVLAGVLATYVPWFLLPGRTIFSWYAVAIAPFVALALALVAGYLVGGPASSRRRRVLAGLAIGAYVLLVVANAWWFWPIWTDGVLPYEQWRARMWLPRWI